MKKFAVFALLLSMSIPLFALGTGIGIGAYGGIEMMVPDVEDAETQNFIAIGGIVDFSLPGIPIGLRGGFEYSWKSDSLPSVGDVKYTDMLILLAGQYNVVLPGAPMSFYLGAGGEMMMASSDIEGSESETDFGFLAYAGACYSMGTLGIFAEVGYGMIFSDPSVTHIPIRGGIKINL
jgi:hypothetical protein